MKPQCFLPAVLLLAALLACGPSQNAIQTAIAQTQAAQATAGSRAALTMTAAAPTSTRKPAATHTPPPTETPPPSDTSAPTRTPKPTRTATPRATPSPAPTHTATARPTRAATAGPSFLDTVVKVKKQVENFGGQIDIAVGSGTIDCQQTVDAYEYVAARATLDNVPASLAGAYSLYTQGVSIFVSKAADLYQNCKNFLADPSGSGSVPALQWTVARTAVNDAGDLLRQAIIAAGGTP